MNVEQLVAALDLPVACRVDQRVPKKLLLENGAPTAADRRAISEGVEELLWLAALKPTTIGVPEYQDDTCEYVEIAVLRLLVREASRSKRLIELVHRAIPYPVLLLVEWEGGAGISVAHIRWSQGEAGRTVLEGEMIALGWTGNDDGPYDDALLNAMALSRQPQRSLWDVYQGWIDAILAFQAAQLTQSFTIAAGAERAQSRQEALRECERLEADIQRLKTAAAREPQLPKLVELNLELNRLRAAHAAARARI